MKIVSLVAENVKRLVAVEITPTGNMVEITGRNGQGKTSVLDAIWWALSGAAHIQAAPIRKGASKARIRLDLGEIIVTRTFTRKEGGDTTAITVESAEGARFPSPQKMLDGLLSQLAFDPLAFSRMKPAEQFDALRRFVPDVDFVAITAANSSDYAKRTEVNRRAKEAQAHADSINVAEQAPAEAIDEAELVRQMQQAGEQNAQLELRRGNRERIHRDIVARRAAASASRANATSLREQAAALLARALELDTSADREESAADADQTRIDNAGALATPIDTSALAAALNGARESNRLRAEWAADRARKQELQRLAAQLEDESAALTKAIEDRETQKRAAIAAAEMPVEGIDFGDGTVLLNGVPFEQGSDAEKLRASVAIAAAMNPKLRVIRVRDGSLLDENGMKLLAELADQTDMQIWVEKVDSSGAVGFVLEDGHLKGAVHQPIAATG